MRTNILYIIWSLGLGGAEQVVINLAKGLDKNRFRVFICCLNDEGPFADELKKAGIRIFALNKRPGLDFSIIGKIKKIIRENYIKVVHTHLWGANLWGRLAAIAAGRPVVITEHNVDVWKKAHHRLMDRCLSPFTAKVCVVSERVRLFYKEKVGIPEKKLEVVYNGINPAPVRAPESRVAEAKQELGIAENIPVLANIGRLVPAKANHIFTEAVETLVKRGHRFYAMIIGDGPLMEELIDHNREMVDKGILKFTGLRKDVPVLLDFTDVSVLSSTREGFSIVVLECMAKGIPFVATDVGGNSEQIIDGKTGFLVPRGDARALADAIEKLLKDSGLRRRMGEEAKRIVAEKFALGKMVKRHEEIYEKVIAG